ncbi:MAG: hypothetical protein ACXWWY_12965 [Candidatus Deferrimicrobiaceae bacterium]
MGSKERFDLVRKRRRCARRAFVLFVSGLLAVLLSDREGFAKTLEEVLKEKGVITEADFKGVAATKPVAYQPGKGFTFTSSDGKFQLSVGAGTFANTLKRNGNATFLDTSSTLPTYAGTSGWLGKAAASTTIFDNTERVDVGMYGFAAAISRSRSPAPCRTISRDTT